MSLTGKLGSLIILLCIAMYLVSAVLPVVMLEAGYSCSRGVSKYGVENTNCRNLPVPPPDVNYDEFVNSYKEVISNYFNGFNLVVTIGLLLLYEIALIGSAIILFRGNPAANITKFFISFALIFFDFILSIVVFAIPLQDLTEIDATFSFVAFISIPGILGCCLYFWLLYRIQNIQIKLHLQAGGVANSLSDIYQGAIPDRIRLNMASLLEQIALSNRFLSSGIPSVFRIHKSIDSSLADYSDLENEVVDHMRTRINQIESDVEESLESSRNVTHLSNQQVESVLTNLVSEVNHTVLNRSLR